MPKTTTPKWAVVATWRRFALFATKTEAEAALAAWKLAREAEGMTVVGAKGTGYSVPAANQAAHVIKLADHPLCYIGVPTSDVLRLRAMEEAENPDFERYAAAAKAKSEEWSQLEAL